MTSSVPRKRERKVEKKGNFGGRESEWKARREVSERKLERGRKEEGRQKGNEELGTKGMKRRKGENEPRERKEVWGARGTIVIAPPQMWEAPTFPTFFFPTLPGIRLGIFVGWFISFPPPFVPFSRRSSFAGK